MEKKLRLFKGGRKRDIYEDAKWEKRPIDIDGEQHSGIPAYDPEQEQWQEEKLRSKVNE